MKLVQRRTQDNVHKMAVLTGLVGQKNANPCKLAKLFSATSSTLAERCLLSQLFFFV